MKAAYAERKEKAPAYVKRGRLGRLPATRRGSPRPPGSPAGVRARSAWPGVVHAGGAGTRRPGRAATLAVSAMIGVRARPRPRQRADRAGWRSRPSITGICTSIRIRSKRAGVPGLDRLGAVADDRRARCRAAPAARVSTSLVDRRCPRRPAARSGRSSARRRASASAAAPRPRRGGSGSSTREGRALARDGCRRRSRRPSARPARWQIARPRPVPPNRRVVEASACVNCSNSAPQLLGRDADAGVAHLERAARRVSPLASTRHGDLALRR